MGAVKAKLGLVEAQKFVAELGIDALPIDPVKIAEDLDILVQAADVDDPGVSGMLLRRDTSFAIVYATHIASEGFQRFSVAHELGHYRIPGHYEQLFADGGTVHRSRSGFNSADRIEREADEFAAGLLMPTALFKALVRKKSECLDTILGAARACRTSLPATAVRYLDVVDTPAAVVQSTNGIVDFCLMSESLMEFPRITGVPRGSTVPKGSMTEHFARDKARVSAAAQDSNDVDLRDWFGGDRSLDGMEEVIGLGAYGKCLTFLTTSVLADDDDEGKDLDDRWSAGFSRR
jgi:Zn-dependent peptidase ImmA (M78 family)